MKISVVILTYNSADSVAATIDSARQISDDIHVVDSFSEDGTIEIAKAAGARITQHAFETYSRQRNWSIDTLDMAGDWELHLDSDERLTPELAQELAALKTAPPNEIQGYFVPRQVHFLGRPLRHGGMYPTWHMRFFKRGKGRCEDRLYDQHFFVQGQSMRLKHPMIDDIRIPLGEWTARHNRWAEAEARQLSDGGAPASEITPRLNGNPIEQKRRFRGFYESSPLFLRAFLLFFYRYVIRLGFLDGKEGLIFYSLQTFWFRFLVDAKIYEMTKRTDAQTDKKQAS